MPAALTSWRLPLRLAWRDLRRYKGRSALAALLILLPVLTLSTALTGMTTFELSPSETVDENFRGISAVVTPMYATGEDAAKDTQAFPATGKVITDKTLPSAADVAKQAGAPVTATTTLYPTFRSADGGEEFAPANGMLLSGDVTSPLLAPRFHLVSGRLPTKTGEIAVTDYGKIIGLPGSGAVKLAGSSSSGASNSTVTIVGRVRTTTPGLVAVGPGLATQDSARSPDYVVGEGKTWSRDDIDRWSRWGLTVQTRETESLTHETPLSDLRGVVFALAVGTMAFIAVTALLAGPAFAASATRQRRALGLVAANGGTSGVLRRMVLAQALLLGMMTALIAAVLGAVLGTVGGKFASRHWRGIDAPTDIRVSWLAGLVVVATIASLVAAAAPAVAAGRTNLLQALRGQVSPRVVKKRMPIIGVIGVVLGTGCLFLATKLHSETDQSAQTLLAYLGVPLFFGGAVLAVPYVLMATGRLAGLLPLTPRIAVREVSRQRTRATASIGAVLATVAVCAGASVVGASIDAHDQREYQPSMPMSSGLFRGGEDASAPRDAAAAAAIADVRTVIPQAYGLWTDTASSASSSVIVPCTPMKAPDPSLQPVAVTLVDDDGLSRLRLDASQRATLDAGGVLVAGSETDNYQYGVAYGGPVPDHAVQHGSLQYGIARWGTDSSGVPVVTSCTPKTAKAARISSNATFSLMGTTAPGLLAKRSSAGRLGLHATFVGIGVPGPISTKQEAQLEAVAPTGYSLQVERGRHSPLTPILAGLTAALAVIVLLTTVVSTLLNDAESQADAATLATVGAPLGMRRRIVGAHAMAIGFIGALIGIVVGLTPGLVLARALTSYGAHGTVYAVAWWPLVAMLFGVPLVAGLISMLFARRHPVLTRRDG